MCCAYCPQLPFISAGGCMIYNNIRAIFKKENQNYKILFSNLNIYLFI